MIISEPDRKLCIAPMMDLTDRHYRYLFRLISPHSLLYSEMLTTPAVIHGDRDYLLSYNAEEHPVALQLGGSNIAQLIEASKIGEGYGYDEINLNCGCPSDRVQSGMIGACLMGEPQLVGDCINAMQNAVSVPVTVKCRIGIDKNDEYDELHRFVSIVRDSGCRVFIVHARKAWLQGLSPKENRTVPPLRYDMVYRLKADFPELQIIINGGITNVEETRTHMASVDGVMIGREAYYNPYGMIPILQQLFGDDACTITDRRQLVDLYLEYMQSQIKLGIPRTHMIRHIVPMYQSVPGARSWRRHLSEGSRGESDVAKLIGQALEFVEQGNELEAC